MSNSGASMEQQVEGDENTTSGSTAPNTAEMGEPQAPVQNVLERYRKVKR